MSLLRTVELERMRAEVAASLPDPVTILEVTQTDTDRGRQDESETLLLTTVGEVERLKAPVEVLDANQVMSVASYVCWLPWGTAIAPANRLRVGGVTYEVLGLDDAEAVSVLVFLARVV